ncbi:MAG: universal stress protein, partial [Flavobacteriales bacterium]|nr:universal stress protein [Flavobacteriales bacterium]
DPSILYLLDKQITAPLTLLNIKKPNDSGELINIPQIWRKSCNEVGRNIKVEHEKDSSIADGLLKHISNNKISLLCIGRGQSRNFIQRLIPSRSSTISEIVDKVHVPILVLGTNSN